MSKTNNAEKETSFENALAEECKDLEFAKAWEELQPEIELSVAIAKARNELGLTQKELAALVGMKQNVISRLEGGNCNPSINTLRRVAAGLNKELVIGFK